METWEQVQALSDAEVIARINGGVQHVVTGVDFWYGELSRRRVGEAAERAERLTLNATRLTIANLVVAAIAAVAAVLALVG